MKKFLLSLFLFFITLPAYAGQTSLEDLQNMPSMLDASYEQNSSYTPEHWVYRSLENLDSQYGSLMELPNNTFNGTKPISRHEAALLLINLQGKIHQDQRKLSDIDQVKIHILQEELNNEIACLSGRVNVLETDVSSIKDKINTKGEVSKNNLPRGIWQSEFPLGTAVLDVGGIVAYNGSFQRGNDTTPLNFSAYQADVILSGKFLDNYGYTVQLLPARTWNNSMNNIMGDLNVKAAYKKGIFNNEFILGKTRKPIGYEGQYAPYDWTFAQAGQISRTFNDQRDVGIRTNAEYKWADYSLGIFSGAYNSGNYVSNVSNQQPEFSGLITLKPLAGRSELGKLKIGGGYANGRNVDNYNVLSSYLLYDYKKFGFQAEYVNRGANYATDSKHMSGYNFSGTYFITPKLQAALRYDAFDPDHTVGDDNINEYVCGLNYFLKGNNIRLQLNYVYRDLLHNRENNSQRIILQTMFKTW